MSTPAFRDRRSWWAGEVQYNVSQHMGWLNKATASKTMLKSKRGKLHLGQMGKYTLLPWSRLKSKKHAEKARAVVNLSCLPPPTTFAEYESCSSIMATCGYHDLFFNRSVCETEREAAGQVNVLSVPEDLAWEQFVKVFPDSTAWVPKLAKKFNTDCVKKILVKSGYAKRGLPMSHFTMLTKINVASE